MWKINLFSTLCLIWIITIGTSVAEDLEEDLEKKSHGCNTTSKGVAAGSFELNIYNATICYWNITKAVNQTDSINLFFTSLFLHPTDKVNIYESYTDAAANKHPLTDQILAQNGSLSIITMKENITIKYEGTADFIRNFEVYYTHKCIFPVSPDVKVIHSPIYAGNVTETIPCDYNFNKIQHMRVKQVLIFEKFNLSDSDSSVTFKDSSLDGEYHNDHPEDIFTSSSTVPTIMTVKIGHNSLDYFTLKVGLVDSECSGTIEVAGVVTPPIFSPPDQLNNGTIVTECRSVIKHKDPSQILGLKFDTLNFSSVFDIIAVNDGLSELSTPLLQVTTSNRNATFNQVIRSTGNYLWISFKPVTYASSFKANVSVHGQGGYFKNSGNIKMTTTTGDDTVFQLEVDKGKKVILNFIDSSFSFPATLSIYDGFDTSHLLTSLHGQIKYPVISQSSQMMIIATHFNGPNGFTANFTGFDSGCIYMSSLSTENYFLPEKCNSTCQWIVPPQDTTNSILLLALQYVSLREGDSIEVYRLDAQMTKLGLITSNQTHVPHVSMPANAGALVKIIQAPCVKQEDNTILVGHSSYIPACNRTFTPKNSEEFQISSPLYPDTYPLFSNCYWTVTATVGQLLHLAFQDLKLAENHCVRVTEKLSKTNITYVGESLPDDLFLYGNVSVEFDSSNCAKKEVSQLLKNDVGFVLNITAADCGAILDGKTSGEFNTSMDKNKRIGVWKVTVPPTDKDSVNIITFSVVKKDDLKNYELHIYDGSSVRDNEIVNISGSEIWSRTNTVIVAYSRINLTRPSSVLVFKYNTLSCNKSMQCKNKICMHPDWRCNDVNECGDYSDERNCEAVPVSPDVKPSGYTGVVLGICIFVMLIIGIALGLGVPVCYQKYKDSRYTRFRELSGIDG